MKSRWLVICTVGSLIFLFVSSIMSADNQHLLGETTRAAAVMINLSFQVWVARRIWVHLRLVSFLLIVSIIAKIIAEFGFFLLFPIPILASLSALLNLGNLLIFLPIALYGLWVLGKYEREAETHLKSMGFSGSEIRELREMVGGNYQGYVDRIEEFRKIKKVEFQNETGISLETFIPEIGVHISWSDILNHVFKVHDLDQNGTTVDEQGNVMALSPVEPYGYLLVESPILDNMVYLPINHSADFLLAVDLLGEDSKGKWFGENELLVVYSPKRVLPGGLAAGMWHVLHFAQTPHGTLNSYYSWERDIHMALPQPEKIFGKFRHVGFPQLYINDRPRF